jgi:hypothetical protein
MFNHKRPLESGDLRKTFSFAMALMLLKEGDRVQREHWMSTYVGVQQPDQNSRMRHPYLFQDNASGQPVPWVPTQLDIFAEDWRIYETLEQVKARAARDVPALG